MSRSEITVEFGLLGAVEIRAAGQLLPAGRPQQRHVLAVLAVEVGRPVSAEALIDRVWDQAPAGARHTMHVHITALRRLLAQATGADTAVLVRRSGGYLLNVDSSQVDLHRFRDLRDQSGRSDVPDEQRAALLRQALGLWRGQPLTGLAGAWAQRMRQAWRQEYLDTTVAWADIQLRLGNPGVVIGPLTELAGEHPFAESLTGVLMRALYTTGRAAEAVDRYQQFRQHLADELGIDPNAEVQRLHQAILRGDLGPAPSHAPTPSAAGPRVSAPAVPAQLPADVTGFAGRDHHLARLDQLLQHSADLPTAVVISAIAGTAGVGKTALAVHWAHRVRHRFPDGQLYVNLRGFYPSGSVMDPAEALRSFLDALGIAPQRIPADLDAQAALYRSQLANKRILVLLDNARDTEQARPLLPAAPGCLAVVTSRNQLTGLITAVGAHPLTLDLLTIDEARQLLTRRLGSHRVTAEPAAVEQLITACVRLPLALAIVVAHAAIQPKLPLAALSTQLRTAQDRLDVLSTGDPVADLRAVFSWSYQQLSPDTARLFRLLGLHPGPDISRPAVASLTGAPQPHARSLLTGLTGTNLITEHIPGRYTLHDLLRAYATEQAHAHDPDADRQAATHRALDHYLHTAHTADRLLNPHREPITLSPPQSGVTPEHLTERGQALAWFTIEHRVLLAALHHAATTGFDTHTWQLAWTLTTFLAFQGHWHDLAATQETALAAARRSANRPAQAYAHRTIGHARLQLGRYDEAHTHVRHALTLYGELADHTGQARTHRDLGVLFDRQGRHRDALAHAQEAYALFGAIGHQVGQAHALNDIGWYHAKLDDHQQALTYCQRALTLCQELGDRHGEAATWDSLGYTQHHLGHHTMAITCYQYALDLHRHLGDRYFESKTLNRLGDIHHATGNTDAASTAWQHALDILNELDHPDADQLHTKLNPPAQPP